MEDNQDDFTKGYNKALEDFISSAESDIDFMTWRIIDDFDFGEISGYKKCIEIAERLFILKKGD